MIDFSGLSDAIRSFDSIVIFRHIHPDCDALGSQFGLKTWILDNYPDKHVYALGAETTSQGIWPKSDECTDEVIAKSLAIVLDTAAVNRCDDARFVSAKMIVKIDHHPDVDGYGDLQYVNSEAAAACEILAGFLKREGKTISRKCAEYIYKGILTDTLRFTTSNTTAETLKAAAFLASHGVNIPEVNRELFDLDLDEFRLATFIRTNVHYDESGLAWLIMKKDKLEEFGITGSEARGHIDEIGHVRDFRIWAMFTEALTGEANRYEASLRSKKAVVNEIAAEYGGGGHKNAAGIKGISEKNVNEIISRLKHLASIS